MHKNAWRDIYENVPSCYLNWNFELFFFALLYILYCIFQKIYNEHDLWSEGITKVIPFFFKTVQASLSLKKTKWGCLDIYKSRIGNTHLQGLRKSSPDTRDNKCVKKYSTSLLVKANIRIPTNVFQLPSDIVWLFECCLSNLSYTSLMKMKCKIKPLVMAQENMVC